MYLWNIYTYSHRKLCGTYWKAMGNILLCLIPAVLCSLVPKCLAAVLLHRGLLTAQQLFHPDGLYWQLLIGIWELASFAVCFPLQCGVCAWLTARLGLEEAGQQRVFFPNARAYWQGFAFFAGIRAFRTLAALPCLCSLWLCGLAFQKSAAATDGGLWLFLAVQCLFAAVWTLLWYLKICLAAAASTLWFLRGMHNPMRALHASCAMLDGRCWRLFLLGLPYLPGILTLVGIPFLLPHLITNYVLLLQLRMREWLEEEHHAHTAILRRAGRKLPPRGVSSP